MSVPVERMVNVPRPNNRIMGMPKWAFWGVIVLGIILAYYIIKRSNANSANNAAAAPDSGLTSADIGGTPDDNSFATATDEQALEEQIQSMQDAIAGLEATNGGNGAGIDHDHDHDKDRDKKPKKNPPPKHHPPKRHHGGRQVPA